MGRPRVQSTAPSAQSTSAGRSPASTEKLGDVSRLLRARSFWVDGDSKAAQRVRTNLQLGPVQLDRESAAWISDGRLPDDKLGISLDDGAALLGPHSFGFLNNLDGIAPLAAPLGERPRVGRVALVVPRRDALPELAPLLCSRLLGVSWLISVGDGDPAEVLRFLQHDPATAGLLVALGKGVRPQSLLDALSGKPSVVLLPTVHRDLGLLRAVARRALSRVTASFEEWLAHGALLDAGFGPLPQGRSGARRGVSSQRRASVLVFGAGADLIQRELDALRLPGPIRVDADDEAAVDRALLRATEQSELLILCGDKEQLAELRPSRPALLLDPSERDRLRALLVAMLSLSASAAAHAPVVIRPIRERLETVLHELPPPLYVAGEMVKSEPLSDHDAKRLLHSYGVRVTRQAPVSTTTSALRVVAKLGTPVWVLPGLPPSEDVTKLATAEARDGVLCETQAEVKRQTSLLLGRYEYVLLREVSPRGPSLRVQLVRERGLGDVLRVEPLLAEADAEASLLPLFADDAEALARVWAAPGDADQVEALATLISQVAACIDEQKLQGELVIRVSDEPVVLHAALALRRER
ncbi:MAG: hypothetical protein JNM40_09230 [Myxococcales bacterium]|nr:hypothetical protein [Myxococcales bacterium]